MLKLKIKIGKRYSVINPPQNGPLRFEYTYPPFLPPSETVLEVLFHECLFVAALIS